MSSTKHAKRAANKQALIHNMLLVLVHQCQSIHEHLPLRPVVVTLISRLGQLTVRHEADT